MQVIAGSNVIDITELHRKLASAEGILVCHMFRLSAVM